MDVSVHKVCPRIGRAQRRWEKGASVWMSGMINEVTQRLPTMLLTVYTVNRHSAVIPELSRSSRVWGTEHLQDREPNETEWSSFPDQDWALKVNETCKITYKSPSYNLFHSSSCSSQTTAVRRLHIHRKREQIFPKYWCSSAAGRRRPCLLFHMWKWPLVKPDKNKIQRKVLLTCRRQGQQIGFESDASFIFLKVREHILTSTYWFPGCFFLQTQFYHDHERIQAVTLDLSPHPLSCLVPKKCQI